MVAVASKRHHAHRKTRIEAKRAGATACFWCRRAFGDRRPPTREHVHTKAERREGASGRIVFACYDCNHARGNAAFGNYTDAVVAEHHASHHEGRPFVPPKGVMH